MKEKNLLYFSALIVVIVLLSILSDFFLLLVHGFSQAVFEGNSTGKTFVMFLWFFLFPLISVLFLKLKLIEKLSIHSKKFLAVFLVFAVAGYSLGLIEFGLISSEFHSLGPFATIAEHNGAVSWEASKLTHNHFPKASLYALESFFGFTSNGSFDDGFPWYAFIPNANLWSFAYLLIELIILVSGILFLNSKIKEISFFDFLVFTSGFLALFISVLDGGIGSGAAMMAVFFLAVFFSRNYLKAENHVLATLLPLMVIGFIGFADVVLPVELGNNFYASSIILFFGLAYFFVSGKKSGKLKFNALNSVLALLLVVSFFMTSAQYLEFAFGREIQPNYLIYNFQEKDIGAGFFVYGLPEQLEKEKVDSEVQKFGKIISSSKSGWSYYALINPNKDFRTFELETVLRQEFSNG
ncbi:hypothetical protein KKB11_06445, partial [Candidatus Micrarchaeota archaeon]|nr:hypothetical protein [Candidatus Micrarchaeota archaeon]